MGEGSELLVRGDQRGVQSQRPEGQLILVSAITPTPAGEGRTTVSIGLAQGLAHIGKKVALASADYCVTEAGFGFDVGADGRVRGLS